MDHNVAPLLDCTLIVRGHDHRCSSFSLGMDNALQKFHTISVERVCRLVEQKQAGRLHDRGCNTEALLHTE